MGKRTVKDGEAMVVWNRSGVARQVTGPKLEYLYCSSIRFLNKHVAGPQEYLVVTKVDGRVEHLTGPTTLYQNPTIHQTVSVQSAISLNSAMECVVVYRQLPPPLLKTEEGYVTPSSAGQQIDQIIINGPTLVFPGVGDTVQTFHWSGPFMPAEEKNSFNILNTAKRQLKVKGPVSFRGENKIKGSVHLLFSLRISDILQMLNSTSNLMSDLYGALEVDLNHISLLHIETIQEVNELDTFESLNSYGHLMSKAQELGVVIDHVLFCGFQPDETLRHHIQDLANVHAKHAKDCILREQKQQQMSLELTSRRERLKQEDSLLKAEIEMKQDQLEAEHKLKNSQMEYDLALRMKKENFDMEMARKRNDESTRYLQVLSNMGIDLTKVLCSKPGHNVLGISFPAMAGGDEKNGGSIGDTRKGDDGDFEVIE